MKKKLIFWGAIYVISTILLFLAISFLLNKGLSEVGAEHDKYKKHIGSDVIINNDTLKIVDYSSVMGTFTLSNGVSVDSSLVFKIK